MRQEWSVRGTRKLDVARSGQHCGERSRRRRWRDTVVLSAHDQRGSANQAQCWTQIGAAERLETRRECFGSRFAVRQQRGAQRCEHRLAARAAAPLPLEKLADGALIIRLQLL